MGQPVNNFQYLPIEIEALELALSSERMAPYVRRAGGSRHKAVLLYERNTALSESLYGIIQAFEIALRNAIHRGLSPSLGAMWFDCIPGIEEPQERQILEAKADLEKNQRVLTPGAIIAELNLGFWTSLISARYEKTLWVPYLHKSFPNAIKQMPGKSPAPLSRSEIFDQLERIRNLRNRIAHHEPILKLDLKRLYSETLGATRWICATTANWVHHTNSFNQKFHEKPLSYEPPKLPEEAPRPTPGIPRPS